MWTYGGTDYQRKATKWRCPKDKCNPSHMWIKPDHFDPLIPRSTLARARAVPVAA